jgi:hypothetical protein
MAECPRGMVLWSFPRLYFTRDLLETFYYEPGPNTDVLLETSPA